MPEDTAPFPLQTACYADQDSAWPKTGRHILAQFDDHSIIVYQAYRPAIGHYAAKHQHFGGDFSYNRMSWIKPNFLWMMFRSGWGTKPDQEITLAIRLKRAAFEELLDQAVYSTFTPEVYSTESEWKHAVAHSDVRLQWDPDHGPSGAPLDRRAIQLGLRGETLKKFGRDWLLAIYDISDFVALQHKNIKSKTELFTPKESVFVPQNLETVRRLGVF